MKEKTFTAVILAAGYSHRMRRFKPLLKLGDKNMIEMLVAAFRTAGINDIRVVVGHHKELLMPTLERLETRIIVNDKYDDGMFSSVLAALESLESNVDAFFLLPADIPLVRSWTIKYLMEKAAIHDRKIIFPTFRGRRGHPPLIPSLFLDQIKNWQGGDGLKGAMTQFVDEVALVEVADANILHDMDELADYETMKARFARYHIPTRNECEALLCDVFSVGDRIYEHSHAVAALVEKLLSDLNEAGVYLDEELIVAAGLLHDMAKGQPQHARKAAHILRDMGYPHVADIVGLHMDIVFPMNTPLSGAAVVYVADKFIREDKFIPLEQRCCDEIQKYGHDREIRQRINGRFHNAMMIRDCIESMTGKRIYL